MKKLAVIVGTVLAVLSSGCILHVTHYTDSSGNTVYVGELYSEGNSYNAGAEIQGTFLDAAGNVITTQSAFTCQAVNPHRVVPFDITLPAGTAQPASVKWNVISTPVANAFLATGLEAHITAQVKDTDGKTWFSGVLQNQSANQYVSGFVCAAWYNAAGDVLRVTEVSANVLRFSPGVSNPFAFGETVPSDAATMHMFIDAGVAPPGKSLPRILDLPTSALQHTFDTTYLSGAATVHESLSEIDNSTGSMIIGARISSTAQDGSGNQIAGDAGECPAAVPAGGVGFGSYALVGSGSQSSPTLTVQAQKIDASLVKAITVTSVQVQPSTAGLAHVTGMLKNDTASALKLVVVCAGVYDTSGAVTGTGHEFITPDSIPAGGSASFAFDVQTFGGVANVKAIASGDTPR